VRAAAGQVVLDIRSTAEGIAILRGMFTALRSAAGPA
jgi:hypothetical protein